MSPAKGIREYVLAVRLKESVRTPLFAGEVEESIKAAKSAYPNNQFDISPEEVKQIKEIQAKTAEGLAREIYKRGLDRK